MGSWLVVHGLVCLLDVLWALQMIHLMVKYRGSIRLVACIALVAAVIGCSWWVWSLLNG